MCWNKEVSIATYITVIVLVIILLRRNVGSDRHIAIFSAVFVTIQLMEFFAWLAIERKNRKLNDLVTRLILIFLWMQPLANTFMALKGLSPDGKGYKLGKIFLIIGVVVFGILLLSAIVNAANPNQKFKSARGPNCHLVWSRKTQSDGKTRYSGGSFMTDHIALNFLYLAGMMIPLLFIKPLKKGIILAVLGLVLLIISRKMSSTKEFSSWWCWIAGVFTLAALILNFRTSKESISSIDEDNDKKSDEISSS